VLRLRGSHPLRRGVPAASARALLGNSLEGLAHPPRRSHYPRTATPPGCDTARVWADPRSLAATRGVAVAFLSWGY